MGRSPASAAEDEGDRGTHPAHKNTVYLGCSGRAEQSRAMEVSTVTPQKPGDKCDYCEGTYHYREQILTEEKKRIPPPGAQDLGITDTVTRNEEFLECDTYGGRFPAIYSKCGVCGEKVWPGDGEKAHTGWEHGWGTNPYDGSGQRGWVETFTSGHRKCLAALRKNPPLPSGCLGLIVGLLKMQR